jgi:hypothetical protein
MQGEPLEHPSLHALCDAVQDYCPIFKVGETRETVLQAAALAAKWKEVSEHVQISSPFATWHLLYLL